MKHYYSLNEYYKNKYGTKVYKLSISGGMTCPNRDGTNGARGCIFCSDGGSGEFAEQFCQDIGAQLENAKKRVSAKIKDGKYIAYFQPYTNTYAPTDYLRRIFFEAIQPNYIVGLSIATRPDCLEDDKIELLKEINVIKPVSVELGLQTIHSKTAEYIRRGYPLSEYENAVKKLLEAGIEVVTHIIIGLPGETNDMILDSVKYAGRFSDGVKLQLLHVLKNTDLYEEYKKGAFETLTLEKYTDIVCRAIELLPENVVIHRITGDGDKRLLVSPLWSANKKKVLNYMNREFEIRKIKQGSKLIEKKT